MAKSKVINGISYEFDGLGKIIGILILHAVVTGPAPSTFAASKTSLEIFSLFTLILSSAVAYFFKLNGSIIDVNWLFFL